MKLRLLLPLLLVALLALVAFAATTTKPQVSAADAQTYAWVKERGENLGAVNGTNKVFIVSYVPADAAEFSVYLNGLYLTEGDDYTLVDRTVTLVSAPGAGESVRFWYRARL